MEAAGRAMTGRMCVNKKTRLRATHLHMHGHGFPNSWIASNSRAVALTHWAELFERSKEKRKLLFNF
ncbi:Ubiquitin Carboxyl-Terminal Hydrolase 34 [Manis pentadactyla]|nr:Ubiquitin Carboxyl-Terminal Hydrolase 34 [Manis pentadactyla]